MRYLSIDIETTGLDPNAHQILEFACVLEDSATQRNLDELPRLVILTPDPQNEYLVSPYTALMHKRLWDALQVLDIEELEEKVVYWENGHTSTLPKIETPEGIDVTFPEYIPVILKAWLQSHDLVDWKIVPAGKNFRGFDWQFLSNSGDWSGIRMSHRTLDPGPLYCKHSDELPPDLTECLKRAGLTPTGLHTALGDSLDVIQALRGKIND